MAYTKPNVLIAGASGGVANALLHHFTVDRDLYGTVVLLDRNKKVLEDMYIDHGRLSYEFVEMDLKFPEGEAEYISLLKEKNIQIVVDITDMDTMGFLEATDKAGVTYFNTGMNDDNVYCAELVIGLSEKREQYTHAPHIVSCGMNPGVVNNWVEHGIKKFGLPEEIVHFEYDTSKISKEWHPMMTWSIHEFLVESVWDSSGYMLGRGRDKVRELLPNALMNRENMRDILEPIMHLQSYPEGMIVIHDENVSLSQKYDIPSKFLYAIHPKTTERLIRLYTEKGTVAVEDLELGDNTNEVLDGADSIGVMLRYKDRRVYYFNTISSVAVIGTNATYTQVVIGIMSGLHALLNDPLKPGVHFPEELYHTSYRHFMFDNMRVQEFVFDKQESGHLKLTSFDPMIKTSRKGYVHDYII